MQIVDVVATQGVASAFVTDQRAMRHATKHDGLFFDGDPVLPGFKSTREVPEVICIQLVLDDGSVAHGDGSSTVFPGRAGVDPPARAEILIPILLNTLAPMIEGRELTDFRSIANEIDAVQVDGQRLHSALRWSISSALLDAVALSRRVTKAEVLADEWGMSPATEIPPLMAQSSNDWEYSLDKVIMRRIKAFHRSTRNQKVWEEHPEKLKWLRDRVVKYAPDFQLDVQLDLNGFPGRLFDFDTDRIVASMVEMEAITHPLDIIFASPVEMPDRESQAAKMAEIRQAMKAAGVRGGLIADYFCASVDDHKYFADMGAGDYQMVHAPTIGSVQGCMDVFEYIRKKGVKTYTAGTATGTDRMAQTVAHMALAASVDFMLLTPGGGVDTPHEIAHNEMLRALAMIQSRRGSTVR